MDPVMHLWNHWLKDVLLHVWPTAQASDMFSNRRVAVIVVYAILPLRDIPLLPGTNPDIFIEKMLWFENFNDT